MTTYNPNLDFFAAQIASIVQQTYANWICIIHDDASRPDLFAAIEAQVAPDPRFRVYRNPQNLGFYANFEQCLLRVPPNAEFVALADQDDIWFPDKLASLLAAFTAETTLVYSDMHLVDEHGALLSPTYWTTRQNQYSHLPTLLLANTITGAASLFRATLLPAILPFPRRLAQAYHDHWIACVALAQGTVGYVERPLYAYRQHGANAIGHYAPAAYRLWPALARLLKWDWSPAPHKANPDSAAWQIAKQLDWLQRIVVWAQILQVRLPHLPPARQHTLHHLARLDRSWRTLLRFVRWEWPYRRATLGLQWYILAARLAQRRVRRFSRAHPRAILKRLQTLVHRAATHLSHVTATPQGATAGIHFVYRKIAPLQLYPAPKQPRRVNLLTSTIDFKYFFGGYLAVFNLALKLDAAGYRVRLVLTDKTDYNPARWRQQIQNYPGLEDFFERIEVACVYDRTVGLAVHPQDRFIATSWWTAHIAHQAAAQLGPAKFIYLTQDFEPVFYPHGTFYALALQSYALPHYALFSTPFLQDFSRQKRLGVFANGLADGERDSTFFQNAIAATPPTLADMKGHRHKRLLFYARPEAHAERNGFVLGAAALIEAIKDGHFDPAAWQFLGMGSTGGAGSIPLTAGLALTILPKVSLAEYYQFLPTGDLGLALMLTPHPSLVPLDMAAAGLVTVTNTFDTKTAPQLEAISPNLIAAPPTIPGLKAALIQALQRVECYEDRLAGTRLNWATDWDQAFNPAVLAKLHTWLQ